MNELSYSYGDLKDRYDEIKSEKYDDKKRERYEKIIHDGNEMISKNLYPIREVLNIVNLIKKINEEIIENEIDY